MTGQVRSDVFLRHRFDQVGTREQRDLFASMDARLDLLEVGVTTIGPLTSSAAILDALQAGGRVHFTPGDYDLSDLPSDTVLSNALRITGDGRDRVTITVGGAAQSLAADRFLVRASLFVSGVKFIDGANVFSIEGLSATIADVEIEDCWFENVGSVLHHNSTSPSASAALTRVRFNRNIVRNCNSGVHLRLGDGAASAGEDIPITYFEAVGNDLEDLDKYGIVCAYDSPQVPYATEGVAIARGNRIVDLDGTAGSTVTGFGINLSAAREAYVLDNYLKDILLGVRTDLEPIYSKNLRVYIIGNVIIDGGENQAAIGVKGDDDGQVVEVAVVAHNTIVGETAGAVLNGIWLQGSNVYAYNNVIRGLIGNSAIRTQSTAALKNLRIENNEIVHESPAGAHGVRIDTSVTNLVIRGNRIRATTGSTGTFRSILLVIASGETIDNAVLADNILAKDGYTGTQLGIELHKDTGATLTNPQILRNHGDGLDTLISLVDQALDGTVLIMGNSEVGVTTDVSNVSVSTLSEGFNSWNIA